VAKDKITERKDFEIMTYLRFFMKSLDYRSMTKSMQNTKRDSSRTVEAHAKLSNLGALFEPPEVRITFYAFLCFCECNKNHR
jgi:hypothetical protein